MQLAHPFIRLPLQFDASRLREEVLAIPEDAWNPHPQGFPGNSALLLISREAPPRDDALSEAMLPTPNLDALPYLRFIGITPLAQDRSKKLSQHTLIPPDPNKWRKWRRNHVGQPSTIALKLLSTVPPRHQQRTHPG